MAGVLDKVRVLDLSWGIAGPMAAMLMADHGADVTKIEPPGGDPYRGQLGYKVWQRGKKSAVFDLKDKADHDLFLSLAKTADVLIESYAPGVAEKLGISYATLSQANPRLIYCSITGYGRGTKDATRPAYDALTGPASAPSSRRRSASMRRCARASTPAADSASRPRCCKARWPAPPASGCAPRKSIRRASTRGSSARARRKGSSSARTASGSITGCRTRASSCRRRRAIR
jgi:hypothetical protein